MIPSLAQTLTGGRVLATVSSCKTASAGTRMVVDFDALACFM